MTPDGSRSADYQSLPDCMLHSDAVADLGFDFFVGDMEGIE